jgi:hypothetical protein
MGTKLTRSGRVFLDEPAFIVIVSAAIEAYRRECYGASSRRLPAKIATAPGP